MIPFWDLYKNWLSYLEVNRGYSQKTTISYASDLKIFISFLEYYLGEEISLTQISELRQTTMRAFVADLCNKNYQASSRSRIISAIRNFVKYLKRENYLSEDFTLAIKSPKLSKALPKALSTNESLNLFENLKTSPDDWIEVRDVTVFLLMYTGGLRISEALSLTQKNINADYLLIMGKGQKERIVPLLSITKTYLEKYLSILPYHISEDSKIFRGEKGGDLNPRIIQRKIAYFRTALNLPENTTPHSLRHSFATDLLDHGANLREIQELLGHKTISTTERYTKVSKAKLLSSYQKALKR